MKTPSIATNGAKRRKRVQVSFTEPTRTKQAFKDECDVNTILKRYKSTGVLPNMIKENAKYGDFSSPLDYQESLNLVLHAQQQFNSLSSHVRERFNNDPQKFLEFTSDSKNIDEMVKLGLATKRSNDQTNDEKEPSPKADPKNVETKESQKK